MGNLLFQIGGEGEPIKVDFFRGEGKKEEKKETDNLDPSTLGLSWEFGSLMFKGNRSMVFRSESVPGAQNSKAGKKRDPVEKVQRY